MKENTKNIIYSAPVILLGALISFGPRFIFKACSGDCSCCGEFPQCFWSTQAEIGMGLVIVALGMCLLLFTEHKTQLGLLLGIFFTAVIALLIPNVLIGGCETKTMACHRVAFPALTIESGILLALSAFMFARIKKKECGNCS